MPISNPGGAGKSIAWGSYNGDAADLKQIPVGFKCSSVIITYRNSDSEPKCYILIPDRSRDFAGVRHDATLYLHADDGFVVSAVSGNQAAAPYDYWAISE